jgi:hypothetical protein
MTEPHKRPYRYPKYKTAYWVNNWREYEQSLRVCGDIMLWISQEAIAAWRAPMTGKRGAVHYANFAIETALALRPALSSAPAVNRELAWLNHETDAPGITLPRSYHAIAPQCHRLESVQEGFPFQSGDEVQATHYTRDFTHTVIDTGQRPKQVELKVLSEGCDLLVVPAVPASLDTDGLVLTLQALADIGNDRYRVLLVKVPPLPEPEGPQLRGDLTTQEIPLFAVAIPRLQAFEKAAAAGVPVYGVKDPNAKRAWPREPCSLPCTALLPCPSPCHTVRNSIRYSPSCPGRHTRASWPPS